MRLTRVVYNWKEAATVMMFAKNTTRTQTSKLKQFDYNLLMLERSSKSKFMPSAYVFPGGGISEADYSKDWLDMYKQIGIDDVNTSIPAAKVSSSCRAPMLSQPRDWPVCSDVAFRICSIRETFEEAGILLCKHKDDIRDGGTDAWKALDKQKLKEWQPAVNKAADTFLEMCDKFSVVPDIWSLHDWSCWLTPTNMDEMHNGKRYDTMFYICVMPEHVDAVHDQQEIVYSKWVSVSEVVSKFSSKKLWIPPPQMYELGRLANFPTFDALEEFCQGRQNHDCERWLPVRITCNDGICAVLPGDDLYPVDVDIEGLKPAPEMNETLSESLAKTKNIHRFEIRGPLDVKLHCTVPQSHGHAAPVPYDQIITSL